MMSARQPHRIAIRRLPAVVSRWYQIFRDEGLCERSAMRRAIERSYDSREISGRTMDRIERCLEEYRDNPH